MLRVLVQAPPKPIGTKGWQQQTVGIFFFEAPGVESPYPVPIPILVEQGSKGYAPGEYRMDPATLVPKADTYGKLYVTAGRLVLQPVKAR